MIEVEQNFPDANATGDNMPSVDESGPSSGAWIIQENDVDACASNN
jgi:hypothetical protein